MRVRMFVLEQFCCVINMFFFLQIQSQIHLEDIPGNGKYIFKTFNVCTTNFIYFLLSVTLNLTLDLLGLPIIS